MTAADEKDLHQGIAGGVMSRSARLWGRLRLGLFSLLPLLAVACSTVDGPGVQSAANAVPSAAPRTTGGTPANTERKRLVELFGGEYSAPTTERFLNDILARLAPASQTPSEPYRVTILNSPIVNAFALPSGDIFVTRGLLALADDSSEIAAVMSHEIAHVTAQHAAKRAEKEKTAALFARVSTAVLDRPQEGQEQQAKGLLSLAQFSREQEFEADKIGIKTIGAAGYDPFAAARFLGSLGRWTSMRASLLGQNANVGKPDMMSTHPSTPERIAQAVTEARQIGAPGVGESGREAYLSAIGGLPFGDDPAEGLVRGPRFVHPKLGFAFAAPEGFVLENQSTALIGVGDGGAEALQARQRQCRPGDRPRRRDRLGLDRRPEDVVGRDAENRRPARGDGSGARRSMELPPWRGPHGPQSLPFDFRRPRADAGHRRALSRLDRFVPSAEPARGGGPVSHPQRIQIVEAAAGDTPETMAHKMAIADRPLDHFLLLNGLESGATLRPGARYKDCR